MNADERMAQRRRIITGHIETVGWSVLGVGAGERSPGYAYTIGASRTSWGREATVIGTPPDWAKHTLNAVVRAAQKGVDVLDRNALAKALDLSGAFIQLMPVDASWLRTGWFQQTKNYYRLRVTPATYQLALADAEGRFPWDAGCTQPPLLQMWERAPVIPPSARRKNNRRNG